MTLTKYAPSSTESVPEHWTGVNGDTKPVTAPAGSTFFEADTGLRFMTDGTTWAKLIYPAT